MKPAQREREPGGVDSGDADLKRLDQEFTRKTND